MKNWVAEGIASDVNAVHMISFEFFVKAMPPNLSESKVLTSFCFAFKISDNVAATSI